MTTSSIATAPAPATVRPATHVMHAGRRFVGTLPAAFAWTVLVLMTVCAIFGHWLMPHSPVAIDLQNALAPPIWSGGDWDHALGTDRLGRDVLSRLIGGARPTFIILLTGTLLGGGLGGILGCVGILRSARSTP